MNCWDANLALNKRFAFIDAMSSAVSLAIQMIELVVIATCANLGSNGLELAIGISAFTSIFFESIGTLLAQILGCSRGLLLSVAMKILAHIILLFAVIFATQNATVFAWAFITIESVISSIAIGGMIASYRPSYGLWYQSQSGKSVDLMQTFAHHRLLRAIGPIIVWVVTFILVKVFAKSALAISIPTILVLTAVALRAIQFMLYQQDLRLIFDLDKKTAVAKKIKSTVVEKIKLITIKVISSLKFVFKSHCQYALYYIYGNIFSLIMVTYLLGEISRMFVYQALDHSTMVMLGMLGGLIVNLFSSFIGAKYYPMLLGWAQLRLFCAVAMAISVLCSVILVFGGGFFRMLALSIIAVTFYLIGVGIVRYISTSFMRISEVNEQSIFFSVTEILSSVLWLIVMLALATFDNHLIGICSMVILFALVGVTFFWRGQGLDHDRVLESGK